tara:strand:+ start:12362 stop:12694 length:333 start_codon:yes stop_codon:yes gene_type:complete
VSEGKILPVSLVGFKPIGGMPPIGLNTTPAKGNILKPDSPSDWRETGAQVTGSPWKNGYCEYFNGKLRDELRNGETLFSLKEANIVIEQCASITTPIERIQRSAVDRPRR